MLNGYVGYLKKSKQGEHEPGADRIMHENPDLYFVESLEDSPNDNDTIL